MRWLRRIVMRMRMLVSRRAAADELDRELAEHLERMTAENRAAGMSAEDARTAALRSFGNPALLRDQTRATWSWSVAEIWLLDLRYGVRTLRRTPGFTAVAVLVMALGIGANVALFTVVRSVVLKPLPYPQPERLVALSEHLSEKFVSTNLAPGVFAVWQKQQHSLADLAMYGEAEFNLSASGGRPPEKLIGIACGWDMPAILGVQPALGRSFTASEDRWGTSGTVLLSWSLWQRRFGGDPGVVNRAVQLNGRTYTVIGVMPRWFTFPMPLVQLWTPIRNYMPPDRMEGLGAHNYQGVGRLLPGITAEQATADLSVITQRLHNQHLDNAFVSVSATTRPLLEDTVGDLKKPLYILLAATGCVLLIACLNVANLLVARAAARSRELAIRAALGGGHLRLLRERLMESLLLSVAGGVGGLLLAAGAVRWLVHARHSMARVDAIDIDWTVVAFTVGITLVCALTAGLASSLGAGGQKLLGVLQDASRGSSAGQGRTLLRRALLTAEVGLTVILLVSAGLLLKSYERLRSSDLGCRTDNMLTMRVTLFGKRYNNPPQVVNFYSALLERVRALPGVQAAGFTTNIPGESYGGDSDYAIVGHPPLPQGQMQSAINRWVDPGYFAAMGIPIKRGRTFDPSRRLERANEAVVDEAFVRRNFRNEEPLGKQIHYGDRNYEIVGIVGDTRYRLAKPPEQIQYYSLYTGFENGAELVIHGQSDVERLAGSVEHIVAGLDADVPVSDVMTLDQMMGNTTRQQSFNATLLAGFAVLSLALAAAGIFGVLSYLVAQRISEIGIRMALGAPRATVLRTLVMDGLRPAVAGLLLGLAGSAAVVRLLQSMLYETQPFDPLVFGSVAAALLAVAVLACLAPAWRAAHLDPMQALRTE